MSYIKRENVPVPVGWTAVEFEDGTLARVSCGRKTEANGVGYYAQAVAIDAAGIPLVDAVGRAVATGYSHTSPVASVEQHGDGAITQAVLLLVMGEPTTLFPWPDSIRTSPLTNIRSAVAAAAVSGTADSGAVL